MHRHNIQYIAVSLSIIARPDSPGRPGGPWITQIFMNNYIAS